MRLSFDRRVCEGFVMHLLAGCGVRSMHSETRSIALVS